MEQRSSGIPRCLASKQGFSHIAAGQGLKESETKTDSGRRSIVLADHAIAVLNKHRTAQLGQRLMAGNKWREHGLVFCSIYGTHTWSANVGHVFVRLLHDAELPSIQQEAMASMNVFMTGKQGVI